jgi:hypothetical protein
MRAIPRHVLAAALRTAKPHLDADALRRCVADPALAERQNPSLP